MSLTKYTPEQRKGLEIMMKWFNEVHLLLPHHSFIYDGMMDNTARSIAEWLRLRLTAQIYTITDKHILNILRTFYKLNKDKNPKTPGRWVWKLHKGDVYTN